MKNLLLLFACALVTATTVQAQTWGCGERDFKCQLDVRMKALKDNPKDPENYYNLGIVWQRSGNHSQAVETFSMYLAIPGVKPEFLADGYNNRGISNRALKRSDLAAADYTKAIELSPKKPEYYTNRGNAKTDLKKIDEAFADYAYAIAVDPKYYQAYAQRGILYSNLSKTDEAINDFAKSIALDPSYPEPYYNRAVIYGGMKQYDKAIPDYSKYVSLISDPVYLADAYLNRGIAHYYSGKLEESLGDFSKVIELRPTFPNGYKARAMLYRQMKKDLLAEADEKKAAELTK